MTKDKDVPAPGRAGIAEAARQNAAAAEEVRKASDDLAVIHAVLDTKVAESPSDPDVRKAVSEAGEVADRLDETADKLDKVNETLKKELKR